MSIYAYFLDWINKQDPTKLKFLDESHFSTKEFAAKKAVSPRGKPAFVVRPGQIPEPCSMTLITSLNTIGTIFWTTRYGSYNQDDFVAAVRTFINDGVLLPGDILIMDASVHKGQRTQVELQDLLESNDIGLALMPAYSPELNPCEFVFARMKRFIQSPLARLYHPDSQREQVRNFDDLILDASSTISRDSMLATYRHCRTLCLDSDVANALNHFGFLGFAD